ncbi:MAG: lysostaphin resistance A-like protein [Terriglobia bacterium]
MTITDCFLLPDGRLRAGWRAALFAVVFVVILVIASVGAAFTRQVLSVALSVILQATATGGATWIMLRWMEAQPFVSIGLVWRRESWGETGWGLAGAVGLVGGVTAVEWGIGAIRFESKTGGDGASVVVAFGMLTGLIFLGASYEEVLFRGYAFQRIIEGTNGTAAVAVTSLVFGVLHMSNPHATELSTLNTVLAGVLLGLAYLRTRALWLPIGFHFGWNWMLAVLGHPVSGLEVAELPWRVAPAADPVWLHGGSYGPEGGIVATAFLVLGSLYLGAYYPLREGEAPELSKENPGAS